MADRRGHVADLTFAALVQDDLEPGRRDGGPITDRNGARGQGRFGRQQLHIGRRGHPAFDRHAGAQRAQRRLGRDVFDLDQVGLGQVMAWVRQPMRQSAIVGQ